MEHELASEWEKRSISRSIIVERWNTSEALQTARRIHHHTRTRLGVPRVRVRVFITRSYAPARFYNLSCLQNDPLRNPRRLCFNSSMSFHDDLTTLDQVGAETLADYERRAGISARTLLDSIRRDRVRLPPSESCRLAHSLTCNDPAIEAIGALQLHEETRALKMLIVLAEYRDGPASSMFSMRHAYTTAGVHRTTLLGWRRDHRLYDSLMEAIQEEMVDTMRAEAYRRSVVGHDEPLVHQGVKTGDTVKRFSDGLLQFTLMGYDAKFRAKDVNMNVSGSLDSNVNIEGLRDRLAQRLEQKSKAEG